LVSFPLAPSFSYGCSVSAAGQVDAAINGMGDIPFGQLWVDIEVGGQGSAANNYNWMMQALARGTARLGNGRMGIYSSRWMWSQVMPGYNGPTQYPMWCQFSQHKFASAKNLRIGRHTGHSAHMAQVFFAFFCCSFFTLCVFSLSDANYDGVPSFANFPTFAGWTRPAMKQFAGDVGLCGANVDLNWYP
jgi:hypothetical protein